MQQLEQLCLIVHVTYSNNEITYFQSLSLGLETLSLGLETRVSVSVLSCSVLTTLK